MTRKGQKLTAGFLFLILLIAGLPTNIFPQQGIITTLAGGGPNSTVALSADITPRSVAVDASGNIFIAGDWMHQVFKVDPLGNFSVVAGTGTYGFSGDGGPATSATFASPSGVALDAGGNLFIADSDNGRIRRVDGVTGIVTTVAGVGWNGGPLFSGDGGPATSASLDFGGTGAVAVDAQGNLFIADTDNQRIRRVDAATGIITTVAGSGQPDANGYGFTPAGFSGAGGPATSARFAYPYGVALDAQGNLFIADLQNARIRRVDAVTGIITTVAGIGGTGGDSGDGGLATSASLAGPFGVAVDAQGNLFIACGGGRIRRVDATTRIITTVAGNGVKGFGGDGGPAASASLNFPLGVAVDGQGNLFIAEYWNSRIRRVDATSGTINTLAGGGSGGDGAAATSAILIYPSGVATDNSGNVFIADTFNHRIRRVDAVTGIITTVAGNGIADYSGDGGPATSASVLGPYGVALDTQGNLFIADTGNQRIRRVDGVSGIITTVAGNGNCAFGGDGGPATNASLCSPVGVALDVQGNVFVADFANGRVRRVDAVTGIITTAAGIGGQGFSGDGGPATSASLNLPEAVALDAQGNLFIADNQNSRVRRVDAVTGIITTVAGNGTVYADQGDGGPAIAASVNGPEAVAFDTQGNLFISSVGRIRRVDAVSGIITRVAGNESQDFGGDGGPATDASLLYALGVAVDAQGRLFIADTAYNRVRVVPLPPFVALSATALPFSNQLMGTTSAAQTLTLTNTGMVALTISSLAIAGTNAGDYAETNTCGSSLGAGVNCTISVTFTPAAAGSRTATLTITDDAPGSPHTVLLSGTGLSGDFSVTASPTSATVTRGQTATYNLSITPLGNPSGPVTFTCSGAPSEATCTVNPSPVNLSGSGAASTAVTVSTTASSAVGMRPQPPAGPWIWLWMLGLLAAVGPRLMGGRRLAWRRAWAPLAVAMLSLTLWAGCGGGAPSNPGTPAGTYSLTVTGTYTSGTTTVHHSLPLTLKVN